MFVKLAAIAALTLTAVTPSSAQMDGSAGQWRCRHANQTISNNPFETWMYEFQLNLGGHGGFRAQGTYTAMTAGFGVAFQAQGRWQQSSEGIMVQGTEQRSDGTQMRFLLVFTSISPDVISNRYQSPNGILVTHCER
ncbi:hypothetical protein [Enterovirga rhinocerotis]|uniref:Uncharacterized protein n=1 Tax=Enterovirga rhinocerotis TaxID=1339210 RepID=A0A4R7BP49_9HYPH|nr:hypothetical protein [Enterovirga rhinocerotis]TDR87141.1 hypothetical protein EV668_4221 [Enterovirga rhinocerotis]